ncbi:MAG TPA: hypothetical protein PKE10_02955 [Candidatus Saccharibacteria bacterium]|nr:hypothetical protein [Candidatus Saccharibacteria bacterium]
MPSLHDSHRQNRGFTLVEVAVVVPLVMITIGIVIGFLTILTGDAIKSKARVDATFSVQAALDQIEQDIRISTGALTKTTNIASPQGVNNGFNGSGDFNDTSKYLILQQNATTNNPYNSARKQVYYNNQPFACSGNKELNNPLQILIIYFIDGTTLKKRTVVPSYNTNDSNQVCDTPWQKKSCKVITTACPAEDTEVLKNVSAITTTYYSSPSSTTAVTGSQILQADSIQVSLTSSSTIAGDSIDVTAAVRATKINPTKDLAVAPTSPQITHTFLGPATVTFDWSGLPGSNFYDFRYRIDSGAWQNGLSNSIETEYTVNAGHDKQVSVEVTAKNIAGSSSAVSYSAKTPLWDGLNLDNDWEIYSAGYALGFTKATNGEIFLRGLVKKTGSVPENDVIAVLPPGYRPSQRNIYLTKNGSNTTGRIDILTDGSILYRNGNTGWISLDNIRFMPTGSSCTWSNLTYASSNWANYGSSWGPLRACVDPTNRVHIEGLIKKNISGTPPNYDLISHFPTTATRSVYSRLFPVHDHGGQASTAITVQDANQRSKLSWRNYLVSWLAPSIAYYSGAYTGTITNLTLQNGWVDYGTGGYAPPSYTKSGNIVTLSGMIKSGTITNPTTIANLPTGFRPSTRIIGLGVNSNAEKSVRVDVNTNGDIILTDSGITNGWISLDNITFIAG